MAKAGLRNFHVPLPGDLYERLRKEAEQSFEPATEIARHAVEDYLEERKKGALYAAIRKYAKRYAGTIADRDKELEAAALDCLSAGKGEAE